jgi:hypothetical protein
MAEKSSQLDNIRAIDTDSVEEAGAYDTALQTRSDGNLSSDAQTQDDEANTEDVTAETEQLREQIEETRRGMSETIDAIQEKLSFSNISDQVSDAVSEQISGAVDSAKDAFFGKTTEIVNSVSRGFKQIGGNDLAKKAQENPAALALIGAGIAALLVSNLVGGKKKKHASYTYDDDSYDYDFDSYDEVRYTDSPRRELNSSGAQGSSSRTTRGKTGSVVSGALESVSGAATTAFDGVSSAAGSAYETIGGAASKTYEGVGSVANKTYEGISSVAGKTYEGVGSVATRTYAGVGSAAGYAYDKAEDLGEQMKINYNHYIEENPLAVGAVALAVGAAVGFAIPLTRKENEYMGEYRDSVVEKAQATAQDALGTVKQMASEAQKVITEEVKGKTA